MGALLPSQRAEVFRRLHDASFDPSLFRWETHALQNYGTTDVLQIPDTSWRFEFRQDERGRHFASFSPGAEALTEYRAPGSWSGQMACLQDWLQYLHRELDTSDPWAELDRYRLPVRAERPADIPNEPFSPEQLARVDNAIRQIRGKLLEFVGESAVHRRVVEDHLEFLSDAARRQGRRDWMHTLIGVVVSVSFSLGLAPDRAVALWHVATQALSGLLELLPRLPPN